MTPRVKHFLKKNKNSFFEGEVWKSSSPTLKRTFLSIILESGKTATLANSSCVLHQRATKLRLRPERRTGGRPAGRLGLLCQRQQCLPLLPRLPRPTQSSSACSFSRKRDTPLFTAALPTPHSPNMAAGLLGDPVKLLHLLPPDTPTPPPGSPICRAKRPHT